MRVLKRDGTPWEIQEEHILQFKSHRNTIYVVTGEGEFIYPTSLSDIYTSHQNAGYERLDRSNVVNVQKVASYDSERKIALFNKANGAYAVVSEPNEARIKKMIESRRKE